METKSVKSIPKDFSVDKPVNRDNLSIETTCQWRQLVKGDTPSIETTRHQATLHRFPLFQDAVLHGLIIRQPYTGSSFPNEVLHGLIMK